LELVEAQALSARLRASTSGPERSVNFIMMSF
jgi:hypothetical protein